MTIEDKKAKKNMQTFESLEAEQKKEYQISFIEQHKDVLFPFLEEQNICSSLREENVFGGLGDSADCQRRTAFRSVVKMFTTCFSPISSGPHGKSSSFVFGDVPIWVPYELEAAMQVIAQEQMYKYQELFRESSSASEVGNLCKRLKEVAKLYAPRIELVSVEHRQRAVQDLMDALRAEIRKCNTLTVSGTFKTMVRALSPIFPPKYLDVYIAIGKLENPDTKIMLSQFLIAFLLSSEKRGELEVAACFLHTIITEPDSLLRFRNLTIVFTPLFFIDKTFQLQLSQNNFKEPVEALQRFLQFFLENCQKIFAI